MKLQEKQEKIFKLMTEWKDQDPDYEYLSKTNGSQLDGMCGLFLWLVETNRIKGI